MSVGVFVTVELPYANDYQLSRFEDAMSARRWTRQGDGYCAEIEDAGDDDAILGSIEASIEECVGDAGIGEWSATCIMADNQAAACLA